MKKVNIDVSDIFSRMHSEWDGDSHGGSFKRYMNSRKQHVMNSVRERVEKIADSEISMIEIDMSDRHVTVIFEWNEIENVQEWNRKTSEDVKEILQYYWNEDVNAYAV